MTRNRYLVGLILLVFFVMSFLTNILGPIVPDIINSFRVSLTAAAVLPFSFFIAYGVMSIPAGFLVERFRDKPVMPTEVGRQLSASHVLEGSLRREGTRLRITAKRDPTVPGSTSTLSEATDASAVIPCFAR